MFAKRLAVGKMPVVTKNHQRGTPGLLLLIWAAVLPAAVLLAWRLDRHKGEFEWMEYPTALGDTRYYTQLGNNDLYEPNLKFSGQSAGLYRRGMEAVQMLDEDMYKVAREEQGRCLVYQPGQALSTAKATKSRLYYVKSGEDQYVEFGERKFWPDYKPPKDAPAP
ncbi:MAG: hypothetical protein JNJ83_12100 [Verrucomicrobiaceae bacterium]|nr:hypothetical protein [Verrucomicrobiaceae bacterium]